MSVTEGTYTQVSFITKLNQQLSAKGIGITASLSSSKLVLTTQDKGENASVSFNPADCGDIGKAMFGYTAAEAKGGVLKTGVAGDEIKITADSNQFSFSATVNGTYQNIKITLAEGTYTRDSLITELNHKLGGDATASYDTSSGKLILTTKDKGTSARIFLYSGSCGTAGKAIFKTTKTTTPAITAKLVETSSGSNEYSLRLEGETRTSNYTIGVHYRAGTLLLPDKIETEPKIVTSASVSGTHYTLKGQNPLSDSIKITEENNDLQFYYSIYDGSSKSWVMKSADIKLDTGEYSRAELQEALQKKLDASGVAGEFCVSVTESGIIFKALKCGPENYDRGTSTSVSSSNRRYIYAKDGSTTYSNRMSGGFYDYIMLGAVNVKEKLEPEQRQGDLKLSDTYIIGRRDVKNKNTSITKGETDELSLDVTFTDPGTGAEQVRTLKMVLDAGDYTCEELIKQIQEKLDQAVIDAGLQPHSVLVDVGRFDSGVAGANDENSINFYLNSQLEWQEGKYRIDGVRGNSMPALFYSTTGEPIPAYILGTKDISKGVNITSANDTFSINVDGTDYLYHIPKGSYTADALIDKLNEIFKLPDSNGNQAIIKAVMEDKYVKIAYRKQGLHELSKIQGSARSSIFYSDTEIKKHTFLQLQTGANAGEEMKIRKTSFSTFRLRIDRISVEGRAQAKRALEKIDRAIDYLNGKRALYGAYQNRLENIIDINENTAENLESSDSGRMDTDMAEEMMKYTKMRILMQAGVSIQASANSKAENALQLLA